MTILHQSAVAPHPDHLHHLRCRHEEAVRRGYGGVELPDALARKYARAQLE